MDVYLQLFDEGKDSILQSGDNVIKAYANELATINNIAKNTIEFLKLVGNNPAIWSGLIEDYQGSITGIKNLMQTRMQLAEDALKAQHHINETTSLLQLNESSKESIKRLEGQLPASLTEALREGQFNKTTRFELPRQTLPGKPEAQELDVTFQPTWQTVKTKPAFIQIVDDTTFSIAYAYKQASVVPRSWSSESKDTGNLNLGQDSIHYWLVEGAYTIVNKAIDTVFTLERPDGFSFPICKVTDIHRYGFTVFGEPTTLHQTNGLPHEILYTEEAFKQFNREDLLTQLEKNILIPARKELVQEYTSDAGMNALKAHAHIKYLTLALFIKLIDQGFTAQNNPSLFGNIQLSINTLFSTGDVEALRKLINQLHQDAWKEPFQAFFSAQSLAAENIAQKMEQQLPQNQILLRMKKAHERIEKMHTLFKIAEQKKNLLQVQSALAHNLAMLQKVEEDVPSQGLLALETQMNAINKAMGVFKPSKNQGIQAVTVTAQAELIRLCALPNADIQAIKAELDRLELAKQLAALLNYPDSNQRPLHLALQTGRTDIITLLLARDTLVTADSAGFINPKLPLDTRQHLSGLLHFYATLQQPYLKENFAFGRTFSLIQDTIDALKPHQGLDNGILCIGKTGSGTSTFINGLVGISYTPSKHSNGRKYLSPNTPEKTKSGHSTYSETSYPVIIPYEGYNLIDTQGGRDTRGRDLVGGISLRLLAQEIKRLRSLVLVCKESDIEDARAEGIRDTLDRAGKIINKNKALMEQVILVVTRSSMEFTENEIAAQLQSMLKEDLPETTRFLLEHLSANHIMLVNLPNDDFKQRFYQRIENMHPQDIRAYNFVSYHTEMEQFKALLAHLQEYRDKHHDKTYKLKWQLVEWQQKQIGDIQRLMDKPFAPIETAQAQIKRQLQVLLDAMIAHMNAYASAPEQRRLPEEQVLTDLQKYQSRAAVAEKFFKQITPLTSLLSSSQNTLSSPQTSAATARFSHSIFHSVHRGLQHLWQTEPVSNQLVQHKEEAKPADAWPYKCRKGFIAEYEQPVLFCTQGKEQVYVFDKPTTAITYQGTQSMAYDRYDIRTCQPINFYGQSSVACDGERTTLIHTPPRLTPPFTDLDGKIMLSRVLWQAATNIWQWGKSIIKSTPETQYLKGEELSKRLSILRDKLAKLEQSPSNELQFALREYSEQLQDITHARIADSETLQDLEDNIDDCRLSPKAPESLVVSTMSFFAKAPPITQHKNHTENNLPVPSQGELGLKRIGV